MLNFELLHGPVHDGSDRYFIAYPPESMYTFLSSLNQPMLGSNMGRIVEHLVQDGVVTCSEQNLRILLNHWFTHLFHSTPSPHHLHQDSIKFAISPALVEVLFSVPAEKHIAKSSDDRGLDFLLKLMASHMEIDTHWLTVLKSQSLSACWVPNGQNSWSFSQKRTVTQQNVMHGKCYHLPTQSLAPGLTVFALVRRCGGPRLLRGRCASGKRPKRSGSPKAFRRSTRSSGGSSSAGF